MPQKKPGNILNLYNRPALPNPDNSWSTMSSMSFSEGGPETLVPTVVEGKRLRPDAAVERYRQTGQHLGQFDTPEEATRYADALHQSQEQMGNVFLPPRPPVSRLQLALQQMGGTNPQVLGSPAQPSKTRLRQSLERLKR